VDQVLVRFGREILKVVPGRVSTEVDARLSFDTAATVARAHRLIALYEAAGIPRERVLIKIAATWEGIRAAEQLERRHPLQPDAAVRLLPGRGLRRRRRAADQPLRRPHLRLAQEGRRQRPGSKPNMPAPTTPACSRWPAIYQHYKRHGIATEVMGASFRNTGQIVALAGCDLLTISPELLAALQASDAPLSRVRWTPRPPARWTCRPCTTTSPPSAGR
jgi:transaldolase